MNDPAVTRQHLRHALLFVHAVTIVAEIHYGNRDLRLPVQSH
jgi:hypothetical protein